MDPERWKAVEYLYHAALGIAPGRRSTFLDKACPGDPALRREVESLLDFAEHADRLLPDDARPQGATRLRTEMEGLLDHSRSPTEGRLQPAGAKATEAMLQPGTVLSDRFRIVRRIGAGGMGEVYEAEDLVVGESVALKTIRPDIADREDVRERFVRGVYAAKQIAHPNICRIHDLHQHRPAGTLGAGAEITFLTMELLNGETLRARLAGAGPMPLAEARVVAEQLAAAVEAAHRAGVIHRDFKSDNVILTAGTPDGAMRAVVTDFGLARTRTPRARAGAATAPGQILGTPAYMAPEQLVGGRITPAVDIYALGVVLYEMVTGTQPFTGQSPFAVAAKRLHSAPEPPGMRSPGLPPEWDKAILGCLEFKPDRRFAHASEVWNTIAGSARRNRFFAATTVFLPRQLRGWRKG